MQVLYLPFTIAESVACVSLVSWALPDSSFWRHYQPASQALFHEGASSAGRLMLNAPNEYLRLLDALQGMVDLNR
jgi:hypothetical protein